MAGTGLIQTIKRMDPSPLLKHPKSGTTVPKATPSAETH